MRSFLKTTVALGVLAGLGGAAWAENLDDVMKRRGLSQKDLLAAAKTYTPTGKRDEFVVLGGELRGQDV